ncbi:cobyrinate a,c-diamide synthase [Sulfurivermis fontis]|uniref:cobyrinate a,c-diamide synthase n=1 Tax=Sulfurivermis fontis TaxID=1972068 RepID=UPI000FD74386|nr:cobyrinate a,c-diamide synthase [Sulfurivermis fontis]
MARLLISAAHKSSGKTTITLGLCAALRRRGLAVQPFKKGPDYIDPMWLSRAAGRPCHNLDFQTQGDGEIRDTFIRYPADLRIIEGNMGLFDSIDVEGRHSNAALAALLQTPVILVVNVLGMTRSVVPIILGYQRFDPSIRIAGVILNSVAGKRHEERLREVFARYIDIPLLGCIHRDPQLAISERHLGLVPSNEAVEVDDKLDYIAEAIVRQVDLERLMDIARSAPPLPEPESAPSSLRPEGGGGKVVRIGIARDAAFGFYYPGDLERLEEAGAELVPFDALHDTRLPIVDGLFIGGGFPETHMDALAANSGLREAIREAIEGGMPAYAECGGLMYLARSIRWGERSAAMVGIIPGDIVMYDKPQGRGYVRLRETEANPWPREDAPAEFYAHEFHYSMLENLSSGLTYAYDMVRGTGIDGRHDGIVYRNLVANYVHLRDVDGYHWTRRFVKFVRQCAARPGKTGTA